MASNFPPTTFIAPFVCKPLQVAPVSHITAGSKLGGRREGMGRFKLTQINFIPKKKFLGLVQNGRPSGERGRGRTGRGGNRRLANSQGRNHDSSRLSVGTEGDCISLEFTFFRPINALWIETGNLSVCPVSVTTGCVALGKTLESLCCSVFSSTGDRQGRPCLALTVYIWDFPFS